MITTLELHNFRNHLNLSLTDLNKIVFITGDNGIGKTNIIESISFLAPGKGFRNPQLTDVLPVNRDDIQQWAVRCQISDNIFATGFSKDKPRTRAFKIDDQNIDKKSSILNSLRIVWMLPQQNNIMLQGQSIRRKFFDRICFNFYPQHLDNILLYEKLTRERLKILTENIDDQVWLNTIEERITKAILSIDENHINITNLLNETIQKCGFPIIIAYKNEHLKSDMDYIMESFRKARSVDAQIGRNSYAPHRCEFTIFNTEKNVEIINCSTGEQKIMLSNIMIAQTTKLSKVFNGSIILLLDDIFAHLDEHNSMRIIEGVSDLKTQCWITAAGLSLAKNIKNNVNIIKLPL